MTSSEAIALLFYHGCEGGAASASRSGLYPDSDLVKTLIDAMRIAHNDSRDSELIDRRLAVALFSLITQLEGNLPRAVEEGITVRPDFHIDLSRLCDGAYAILENWADFD